MFELFRRNAKYIVILGVFLGAFSSNLARMTAAPAIAIGFYRLTFALPFFALPMLLSRDGRTQLREVDKRSVCMAALAGLLLAMHFFCFFNAAKLTSIASATILSSLHTLVVLTIAVFIFKRHVKWRAVLGILAALGGGVVITMSDYQVAGGHISGDLLALANAVCVGLYFVLGKRTRERMEVGPYILICFFAAWLCFLAAMPATGTSFFAYTAKDFLIMFAMAILCQVGAHAIFNWSFAHVSDLYVSTWETFEGVFASIIAFFIFGEIPGAWQFVGIIIVIGGLVFYNLNDDE